MLQANTNGSDMGWAMAGIQGAVAGLALLPGSSVAVEGTFRAQEEAAWLVAVLAVLVIGNVPLALIGSVAALWIAGQSLQ